LCCRIVHGNHIATENIVVFCRIKSVFIVRLHWVKLIMATVRGILVKQFGGPEVLEHVTNIVQTSKPAARQVF